MVQDLPWAVDRYSVHEEIACCMLYPYHDFKSPSLYCSHPISAFIFICLPVMPKTKKVLFAFLVSHYICHALPTPILDLVTITVLSEEYTWWSILFLTVHSVTTYVSRFIWFIEILYLQANPHLIDVNVLMAVQLLVEMARDISNVMLRQSLFQHVLFNFRIWSRSQFHIRIGEDFK
jgi:hypothetical protein